MGKASYSRASKSEGRKEHEVMGSDHNPLKVLRRYLAGKIAANHAVDLLSKANGMGIFWAGEIALETADRTGGLEALTGLEKARSLYAQAESARRISLGLNMDSVIARSQLRIAHLPLYGLLALGQGLPSPQLADMTYRKTLSIGLSLSEAYGQTPFIKGDERNARFRVSASGALGEIAALSLLEREAIKIGPDSWFPYLAKVSDDRTNRQGSSINRAWDIEVLSALDSSNYPELTYRLDVKAADRHDNVPSNSDIPRVVIDSDLRLHSHEPKHLSRKIIAECFEEYETENPPQTTVASLDERAYRLLELLES